LKIRFTVIFTLYSLFTFILSFLHVPADLKTALLFPTIFIAPGYALISTFAPKVGVFDRLIMAPFLSLVPIFIMKQVFYPPPWPLTLHSFLSAGSVLLLIGANIVEGRKRDS
jgi:hypothetical protein